MLAKTRKRVGAGSAILALVAAAVLGGGLATSAFADELAPSSNPTPSAAAEDVIVPTSDPTDDPTAPAEDESTVTPDQPSEESPDSTDGTDQEVVTPPASASRISSFTVAPTGPAFHLLLWLVPGGPGSVFEPDQPLKDDLLTDVASLDLLDNSPALQCGSYYQVDLEFNSPTTDALVAGRVLHDAQNPTEDHAYGALGEGVNPWKYITTAPCPPPTTSECTSDDSVVINALDSMYFDDRTGGSHTAEASDIAIAWHGPDLSQSKSAGYIPTDFLLQDAGVPSLDYLNLSGADAGLQLVINVDGVWKGTFVKEEGNGISNYWSTFSIPGMLPDPQASYRKAVGTLDDFLAAYWADSHSHVIKVVAVGYSGGSGSEGTGKVISVTAGCTTYTFTNVVPAAPSASATAMCAPGGGIALSVNLFNAAAPSGTTGTDASFSIQDGATVLDDSQVVNPGGSILNLPFSIGEDTGTHTLNIYSGGALIFSLNHLYSDCLDNLVIPVIPTVVQPTCDAPGSITVPEQPAGVYVTHNPDGSVSFAPADHYYFPVGTVTSYALDAVPSFTDCHKAPDPKVTTSHQYSVTCDFELTDVATTITTPSIPNEDETAYIDGTPVSSTVSTTTKVDAAFLTELGIDQPMACALQLAHTGVVVIPLFMGGLSLLVLGGFGLWYRRKTA